MAGCVAPRVDRIGSAIIGGEPSTTEDDAAIGLAVLSGGRFNGACSGVLVAPNLVLTARHCVSTTQAGGLACDDAGDPLAGGKVLSDHRATDLNVLIGPELTFEFAAKGKTIIHSGATNLCNNDIALVVLDTAIEGAKIAKIRLETPPVMGEMLDAVGWGASDNSQGYGRRKRTNIPILAVGPAWPDDIGGVGPREFATGEGICQGDSGGPAFDHVTGAVVGIVSRGGNGKPPMPMDPGYASCIDDGMYKARNFFMRTDGFKDLILQAFAEAGTDPWEENGPDPKLAKDGETCGAAAQCRSNLCMSGSCTARCDKDEAVCPDNTVCTDVEGVLACVPPKMVKKGGCELAASSESGGPALLIVLLGLALPLLRRRV